jgi:hypothetical protein
MEAIGACGTSVNTNKTIVVKAIGRNICIFAAKRTIIHHSIISKCEVVCPLDR